MGSSAPEIVKAVKYYNETESSNKSQGNNPENLKEKIKLEFSLKNCCSGKKYSINASFLEENEKDFLTEEMPNKNNEINFEKFYICNYFFEKEQKIQIILYKEDELIFNQASTLATIVGAKHNLYVNKIKTGETLIIKAVKLGNGKSYVNIDINIKENGQNNEFLSKRNLLFEINCNKTKIYSSESISCEGNFEQVKIPSYLLSPEYTVNILESKSKIIKSSYTKRIDSLQRTNDKNNNNNNIQLKLPISKNLILSIYDNSSFNENLSFFDFISSGIRIKLSIGIDFTGSNGHPLDKGTLHCIINNEPNDYEKVIKSIGNILSNYNYKDLYPVYGFGAILNNSLYQEASMCFNINFKDTSEIKSINNVLKVYRECLDKLTFSGPTFFSPIIAKVLDNIRKTDNNMEYNVLMILTDGVIDDMDYTIDALVEGSFLPLSVIIIGIGDADFSKMVELDGNDIPLVSKQGIKWCRDIVQFIQYDKYKNNENILTKEILEEIPRQLMEYYLQNNYNPDKIKQIVRRNSMESNYYNYDNYNNNQYNQNLPTKSQIYSGQNNNYNPYNNNINIQESKNDLPTKSQIYNKDDDHNNQNNDNPSLNPYEKIKLSNNSINNIYENQNQNYHKDNNNIDLDNKNYTNNNLQNNNNEGLYTNNNEFSLFK